jgi:hypothetical protein
MMKPREPMKPKAMVTMTLSTIPMRSGNSITFTSAMNEE